MRFNYVVLLLWGMSDIVILCQYLSCRSFSASTLILTGDWLNTYLPSCKSVRDDFHCLFHFTIYGPPVNRMHPVIGSIIYPRCLKLNVPIQKKGPDSCVWQQPLHSRSGIFKLVLFDGFGCTHPIQGQYALWRQICFASHYHLPLLKLWNVTAPVEIL